MMRQNNEQELSHFLNEFSKAQKEYKTPDDFFEAIAATSPPFQKIEGDGVPF